MNARCLILVLAALAPVGAMAESPAPAAPTASMLIHCTYGTWPTREQVARNLRFPSVTVGEVDATPPDRSAYAPDDVRQLQQFIRRQGRDACEHGATHVQVDFHPQPGRRVAVLAAAGK